jgi:hypothetical protein
MPPLAPEPRSIIEVTVAIGIFVSKNFCAVVVQVPIISALPDFSYQVTLGGMRISIVQLAVALEVTILAASAIT